MEKIPIRKAGLVGTLFRKGNPKSAVIVLGGSSGGLWETRAQILAENGFAALALAYFATESLPPKLNQIPLEYFEKAISFMESETGICKLALWGGSRGAEASLILGTLFPNRIHAIAAHVPSSVIYGSLDHSNQAAWTFQGKPIAPNAPFQYSFETNGESEDLAIAVTPSFLDSMRDKEAFERSAIPVEKLMCPLLLISAEDDQMWPSALFAKQIVDRLARHQSPIYCSHLNYKGVGHAPSRGTVGLHPIMKRWFFYGGNPADNAFAAKDWVEQTILFFNGVIA